MNPHSFLSRALSFSAVTTLLLGLHIVATPPVAASDSSVQIIVKDLDGNLYSGALVRAHYGSKYEEIYDLTSTETTNAAGLVTLTYPSNTDLGAIYIQPAESDTTHAVGVLDSGNPRPGSTLQFKLKRADFRMNIKYSSGTDAAAGSSIFAGSMHFNTLRAGAFGVSAEQIVANYYADKGIASSFMINAPSTALGQFGIYRYFTRSKTESGWQVSFFSDANKTQLIQPTDGIYVFALRGHNIEVALKDSTGSPITIPSGVSVFITATLINNDGENIGSDWYSETYSRLTPDGLWQGGVTEAGKYRIWVSSEGSNAIPSFIGPFFWVNAEGGVSLTGEAGTFTAPGVALQTTLNIPSNFAKIQFTDRSGIKGNLGFYTSILKKVGNSFESDPTSVPYLSSQNGLGAIALADGDWSITLNPSMLQRPTASYEINVNNGMYTFKDSTGATIQPDGQGIFQLLSGITNVKIRVLNGNTPVRNFDNYASDGQDSYTLPSDVDGRIYSFLPNGTITLVIRPSGEEIPPKAISKFRLEISNGQVQSFTNLADSTNVTPDANGFYIVQLAIPRITGTIKHEGVVDQEEMSGLLYVLEQNQEFWQNRGEYVRVNSEGKFGLNLGAGKYRFQLTGSSKTQLYSLSQECNVPASGAVTCDFNATATNFRFQILDQNNQVLSDSAYGALTQYLEDGVAEICCASPRDTANARLSDGDYRLSVRPHNSNLGIGQKRDYRILVSGGAVSRLFDLSTNQDISPVGGIFKLPLQKSNFRMRVVSGQASVANSWVTARNLDGKSEISYGSTNSEGKIEFFLTEGESEVRINPVGNENPPKSATLYRVKVSNGIVTQVKNSSGTTIESVSGVYPVSLATPNVSGVFSVAGVNQSGHLNVLKLSQDRKNYFWTELSASVNESGKWYVNLEPGNYIFEAYSHSSGRTYLSGACEVSTGVDATCSTAFPGSNMKFDVLTTAGQKVSTYLEMNLKYKLSNGATADSWFGKGQGSDAFELNLLPGEYELSTWPGEEISVTNVGETYTFTVSGEVVENVRRQGSATAIEKVGDRYSLSLKSASIAGTVVADDGTTPVPFPQINVRPDFELKNGYRVRTGSNGQFGIMTEDGTYRIQAYPNYQEVALSESAVATATVANGAGPNNLSLALRRPNVTGTVTGPTGIPSRENYLNVRKLNPAKNSYEYVDSMGRITNALGKFSAYLEPGTYRFEANSDGAAKGGRTFGPPCVVAAERPPSGSVTCDVVLASSNIKLKFVKVVNNAQVAIPYIGANVYITDNPNSVLKTHDWFNSNAFGEATASLETGVWSAWIDPPYDSSDLSRTNLRIEISGANSVISVKDSSGTTLTADSNGFYTVIMPTVNLTGTITNNGVPVDFYNHVVIKQLNGDYYQEVSSRGSVNGTFGFRIDPGTYRIEARPYPGPNSNLATSKSAICEVVAGVNKVCNVALQAGNFLGKVKASDNANFRDFFANLFTTTDKGEFWYQPINLDQGNFSAFLEDGKYRLEVAPYWEHSSKYSQQSYLVTVVGGQIESIKNSTTGTTPTQEDGRYQLVLSSPRVKGKILMPGDSTTTVPYITVLPIEVSKGEELWRFQSHSDQQGAFGLNIPDGTYDLVARVWGSGITYTSSAKTRVIVRSQTPYLIVNGAEVETEEIAIRLRNPNFIGRVIKPKANQNDAAEPLAEVNVNIFMDGQYAYAWTGSDGRFGAYFENSVANCSSCEIQLNSYRSKEVTSKRYTFASFSNQATADQGDLQMGKVNYNLTILEPVVGGTPIPSRDVYIALEESVNGSYVWQPGSYTDYLGRAGLSLETGKTYRITAYPNGDKYADLSPKSVIVLFDANTPINNQITFDLPNLYFSVKDRAGKKNSWGFTEITKLNEAANPQIYEYFRYSSLNEQGAGAATLTNGTYRIRFWPSGKAIGIPVTAQITVTNSGLTLTEGAGLILTAGATSNLSVTLPAGNVSGLVTKTVSGVAIPVSGAIVTAVRGDDNAIKVQTISQSDGTYEFSLDLSFAWEIKVLDPIDTLTGTRSIAIENGRAADALLAGQNVLLT